jgi:hypothetical protein
MNIICASSIAFIHSVEKTGFCLRSPTISLDQVHISVDYLGLKYSIVHMFSIMSTMSLEFQGIVLRAQILLMPT